MRDWVREGIITHAQHQRMERETICELRRTNVFLRLVLFLFTLIIVGAAVGLFFAVLFSRPSDSDTGILLLVFAGVSYAAAEFAVSGARLYRFGIEEALAVCSVGFLSAGMELAFFSGGRFSTIPLEGLVPAGGAVAALWIWHRFGLLYAFLAAMILAARVPVYCTSSHSFRHVIVTAFYAGGLLSVVAVRSRHRLDYLNDSYSVAEGLLWLGIYLATNLQLSSLNLAGQWWRGVPAAPEFGRPFYWGTWVLAWCLPPLLLARGLRRKDRVVIMVGAITAILTLVTNKPYLGWPRHTWDPMILGVLLIGTALSIRRWLAAGPGGIRHGFTADPLSTRDQRLMDAGGTALGFLLPHALPHNQPASSPEVFGGGDSGGGGASSDF